MPEERKIVTGQKKGQPAGSSPNTEDSDIEITVD